MVVAQAIGDQVGNGGDLDAMALGECDEVGQPRHGAVIVHDLADHPRRVETSEPRHVDGGLGVAGSDQHAAILGDQREHMTGPHEIGGAAVAVGQASAPDAAAWPARS